MITLIAEHWIRPEFLDQTMEVFTENSEKLMARGDLVSRLVLRSQSEPTKITTVSTWKSAQGYQQFMDDLEKKRAACAPDTPEVMADERLEGYEVVSIL